MYPKKDAKKDAVKAWGKIKPEDHPAIMRSVEVRKLSKGWTKDNGQFVPKASTFLNGQRWLDEVEAPIGSEHYDYNAYSEGIFNG